DILPKINILAERTDPRRVRYWLPSGGTEDEANLRFRRYAIEEGTALIHNLGKVVAGDARPGEAKRYAAIVGVPIAVEAEEPDGIEDVFSSIWKAADGFDKPVLVLPWLNFMGDPRWDALKLQGLHAKAQLMGQQIFEIVGAYRSGAELRTEVAVGIDQMPQGTPSIGKIRQAMAIAALGYNRSYDTPFMMCDYDSTLGPDAIQIASDTLKHDRALFVNGKIHYTSELLNKTPDEVALLDLDSKLIYLTESLRRTMLDHLPPEAFRGYVPEPGLAIKHGLLMTLGGFNTKVSNSESYWLQVAAIKALRQWYDVSSYRVKGRWPEPNIQPPPDPYVPNHVAERITS
ncbi:MAG: hypothetical protein AAB834_06480, partial [Patescibacteria group bacterium]